MSLCWRSRWTRQTVEEKEGGHSRWAKCDFLARRTWGHRALLVRSNSRTSAFPRLGNRSSGKIAERRSTQLPGEETRKQTKDSFSVGYRQVSRRKKQLGVNTLVPDPNCRWCFQTMEKVDRRKRARCTSAHINPGALITCYSADSRPRAPSFAPFATPLSIPRRTTAHSTILGSRRTLHLCVKNNASPRFASRTTSIRRIGESDNETMRAARTGDSRANKSPLTTFRVLLSHVWKNKNCWQDNKIASWNNPHRSSLVNVSAMIRDNEDKWYLR